MGKCNFVGITGTNGKTTTTTLTGEIFKNAGRETYVVGNIGVAVTSAVLDAGEHGWMITETSSFQLETTDTFKPRIGALLNLTPDHMDRHKTMEEYAKAKGKIFQNQNNEDFFIVNYDDPPSYALVKECKANVVPFSRCCPLEQGVFVKDGELVISKGTEDLIPICKVSELKIPGSHNLENALAAAAIAYSAGIDISVVAKTLRSFAGVAHRLESCGEINGVCFVNDSKGTNPDASIKAIQAMPDGIILIAGGYDKNSDFEQLIRAFSGKVKHMVLMGKTAEKIKAAAFKEGFTNCIMAENMESCVREAFNLAGKGDTVLLSPACASWDMYSCFEQRGEHFKKCIAELRG